jgi:Zn-finger nucleic acid-binding protein
LTPASFDGITLDGCHRCGGVWFDRGELTRMARGDLSQLDAVDRAFEGSPALSLAGETGPCPDCDQALSPFEPPQVKGLQLIGCKAGHGVWLTETDFEAILMRTRQWREQRQQAAAGSPVEPAQRVRQAAQLLLTVPCPKCRQPNATAAVICWACGGSLAPVTKTFACPACGSSLDPESVEGVPVNHCNGCGGLWLDHGELGQLIDLPRATLLALQERLRPETPRAATMAVGARLCPACSGTLSQHEYALGSAVLIETCRDCGGLWLDPADLAPIQKFVEESENYLPPS